MPPRAPRLAPALSLLALACSRPASDDPAPPPSAVVVVAAPPSAQASAHTPRQPPVALSARGDVAPLVAAPGVVTPLASSASAPAPAPAPSASASPPEVTTPPTADGRPLHLDTQDALLGLFSIRTFTEREIKRRGDPQIFLHKNVGPDGPSKANQGNKAIAHHAVAREQCLAGLAGVTLQTDEQRRRCGADNMVPVYRKGDPSKARVCIDVFEFPNRPCELPFVWASPLQAQVLCEMQGKRLCSQEEWALACRGDPEGKADWLYAYGNELDLEVCNTNKPPRAVEGAVKCDPDSAGSAWRTCGTNTEPAGAFPRCRSRFGVYDLHGNVAEAMTRLDADGHTYSQLKGSAFFYVDVARKHDERPPRDAKRETYPDHCAYDPRWHVEPMETAWHVNYHLGFRCCKTIR